MPENSKNIYFSARNAAGFTREHAGEMIGASCRALADWESGQRLPPNDAVIRMVDVYDARYLAYQHLRESSDMARNILPDAGSLRLSEAVLALVSLIYDFADDRLDRQLISIASDGVIDEQERPKFDRIADKLDSIIKAAVAVGYISKP
ncbi:MAG: helix-turn-helix transcriptional regulator [Angelakisella sp.]